MTLLMVVWLFENILCITQSTALYFKRATANSLTVETYIAGYVRIQLLRLFFTFS